MILYSSCAVFLVFAGIANREKRLDSVDEVDVTGDRTCLILRT